MCGRYQFSLNQSTLGKKLKEQAIKLNLVYQEGEIFPSKQVLSLIPYETGISLTNKKWGIKNQHLQINARIESLNETHAYDRYQRCVVVCNGFYEWDKLKNKYYISFNKDYAYLACVFNDDDELVIITEPSYGTFKEIHDRIPLILNKEEMLAYLHQQKLVVKQKKLNINCLNQERSLF